MHPKSYTSLYTLDQSWELQSVFLREVLLQIAAVFAGMVLGKYLGSRGVERWTGRSGFSPAEAVSFSGCTLSWGWHAWCELHPVVFVSLKKNQPLFGSSKLKKMWSHVGATLMFWIRFFLLLLEYTLHLDMFFQMYGSSLQGVQIYAICVHKTSFTGYTMHTLRIWNVWFGPALLWSNNLFIIYISTTYHIYSSDFTFFNTQEEAERRTSRRWSRGRPWE